MKRLFRAVATPRAHASNGVSTRGAWYSWSPEFLRAACRVEPSIRRLPAPPCVSVRGCNPYDSSYSYPFSKLSPALADFALESSEALLRTDPGSRMLFLTGLLDPPFSSDVLHKCFAILRAGIVKTLRDPRTALHSPVKTERNDEGFPLHCDLFLTERLWLVFDDVPKDASGKSLFLPRRDFEHAVRSNRLMTPATRHRLARLFDSGTGDAFDEWFDLIHSEQHPWSVALTKAMRQRSWKIRFRRGEGYLVNDRRWLHGRTAVSGTVSSSRFRRLVFGPLVD